MICERPRDDATWNGALGASALTYPRFRVHISTIPAQPLNRIEWFVQGAAMRGGGTGQIRSGARKARPSPLLSCGSRPAKLRWDQRGTVNTAFMLMAMYSGRPVIPADDVARDFFELSTEKFIRKVSSGHIALPLIRMEASQKCAKGVHLNDLAAYLDMRRDAAVKECEQLNGNGRS